MRRWAEPPIAEYPPERTAEEQSTGGQQVVQIQSSNPLDAAVQVIEKPIEWKLQLANDVDLGQSGPHKVYVTWGAPGAGPTLKRVDYVCTEADGTGSPEAAADALHEDLSGGRIVFGDGGQVGWELLDGGSGDCDNQAFCMVLCVQMVGAGPASLGLVRASSDYGAGNCLDLEHDAGPPPQWLVLDFEPGPGYKWNVFEGCCVTAGHYYAVTPERKTTDDYQMLLALPGQQYWVETQDDIRPGDPECVILLPPLREQSKQ